MTTPPAVILADPQMGENIGAVARAMGNFGLTDLRIVRPRDGWPNARAWAVASGATWVLDKCQVFDRVEDALSGLTRVYGTAARDHAMAKPVLTPRRAMQIIRPEAAAGAGTGLVFGAERAGLTNNDVSLLDGIITIPASPRFSSLNLAQSAVAILYEWFLSGDETPPETLDLGKTPLADKAELLAFFGQIEKELDDAGFLFPPAKRDSMVRSLRSVWHRAGLSEQEVRTLRGVVTALTTRPHAARKEQAALMKALEEAKEKDPIPSPVEGKG
jgi:tRNA/rRNA methyltransferase